MLTAPLLRETTFTDLQQILDSSFGAKAWLEFEPETILMEQEESDPLLLEKILALQALNLNFDYCTSQPEFLIWFTTVANNEPAEFEHIILPTSLELAWACVQLGELTRLLGHKGKEISPAMHELTAFVLNHEGYSVPVQPFTFLDSSRLTEGQTEQDTEMKAMALTAYIRHMKETSSSKQ